MIKIVIDAGHTEKYNQGVIKSYYEGNQMYKLSLYEKEYLEEYEGVQVKLTRNKVTDNPSYSARGKLATDFNLFISNHSNAPGVGAKNYNGIRGVSVYDSVTRPNKSIAETIGKEIAKVMGNNFRGVNYRKGNNGDYYAVLRHSIAANCKASMIIEHGFHTNKEDCAFLLDDANLKKLARAKAEIIAKIYGLKKKAKAQENTSNATTYYRVRKSWDNPKSQLGAFSIFEYAIDLARKNKDYKVFNEQGEQVYPKTETKPKKANNEFLVKVTASGLNIRSGPGTNYKVNGVIRDKGTYTIIDTSGKWGKLKSGAGWIHLDYTKKL